MLLGYWVKILMLLGLAYSSCQVLSGNVQSYGWQQYYYLFAPWLLLYGSLKGWYRAFTWRRMMYAKDISPDLSRGKRMPSKFRNRKSFLEKVCLSLLLLSIAGIVKQFGATGSSLWVGLFSGLYSALRFVFNLVA